MKSQTLLPRFAAFLSVLGLAALALALVSGGGQTWGSFFSVLLLSAALIGIVLFALRAEGLPAWLARLTLGAALLRLLAGLLWLVLLPAYGYDTEVQQAGYIWEDAYQRDTAAWELAESDAPLWVAFRASEEFGSYRSADQYGGMLFLSAGLYRYFGSETHTPLLIVVLAAGLSALAVPLTWALTRRFFDEDAAKWAAWGLAIYPEAVLLGSSQMREAFLIPLTAAVFYGLARYRESHREGTAWILGGLALILPISPPFAGILVGLLAIVGLGLNDWRIVRTWRLWVVLGGLALVVLIVAWAGWGQIAPRLNAGEFKSPLEMAGHWLEMAARWQAGQTEGASGWLQKIFESTPEAFNLPFLIGYGVTRPLLPAQLAAYSVPFWWTIGLWRSLGWTILLVFLLYAPVQALRVRAGRSLAVALTAAVWIGILIAAFWGGGDEWDNPRYRAVYAGLQFALAARVFFVQRRSPDPWMRRGVLAVLAVLAWFVPWYLRRYTAFDQIVGWTVVDIFKLLAAGVLTGVLLVFWDWAKK